MNNKGFAVSGIIYTILIIFLVLLFGILSLFNSRKNVLDKLKNNVIGDVNTVTNVTYEPFTQSGEVIEFVAKARGYYQFHLYSPKIGTTNGSQVTTEIYLSKGETLYFLIGASNYNNGETIIRTGREDNSTVIIRASTSSFVASNYSGKIFTNTVIKEKSVTDTAGKIEVKYLNKEKINKNLNKVKYIKDCINGAVSGSSEWSEIVALVDGDNKARGKSVTSLKNISSVTGHNLSFSTDGDNNTYAAISSKEEQCVIVDLERTYNLDSISILHSDGKSYYGNKTYVSSDGINYTLIRNQEQTETSSGILISSYESELVTKVGNIDVPMKDFDGATWIRVFHHDNLSGKELWSSLSQVSLANGYDSLYRQSILAYLDNFKNKNGEYEFLLEYPQISGYNRWIQKTNPLKTTKVSGKTTVSGYKAVSISWTGSNWGGLAKSNTSSTLLDGSIANNNWFYAIGAKSSWNGGIPGPGKVNKGSVDLWVRIDNLK